MSAPLARISVVIRNVVWVGIVAHAGFVPMFWLLGHPLLAAFNVLSVASWVAARQFNRRGHSTVAMWLLVGEVSAHALLAVMTLGWASGFQYYLIPLIPFVMFNDRLGMKVVAGVSVTVCFAFLGLHALAPAGDVAGPVAVAQTYANIVIPFLALALVSVYFRVASTTAEQYLARMALTDPLTGLLNRRRMDERLEEERSRFERSGRAFGVILADVDHFKSINDSYGHEVGDRVLRAVASVLKQGLRGQDEAARWGGEEFLLLLPDTHQQGARDVADRLREAIERQLTELAGLSKPVTMTFGVTAFAGSHTLEACLKSADAAMYAGKRSGRNRVVDGV
ncbi:MAG: GGDEF domain-containing protein [Archangiaceae bacterium]|nr:GGDEF domain-containing protein [Archangiaceae bacterium]